MSPCRKCEAKCCRYFALQLDTPRTKEDFEKIRWYLAHKGVTVFVDKRKWFLDVSNECRFLGKDHRCLIYDKRPLVCREHSPYECERDTSDFEHELTFNTLEELDLYLDRRFRRKKS
ncbi:MAG: YkgJ family cysteine cluster protein [Candidatus Omnitrophica bacterium]|nr:YkgJ family cysteine cluster protein [Candidatus Omnitrophota bacterium]